MVLSVKSPITVSKTAYVAERRGIWFTVRCDVSTKVDGYISLVKNEIGVRVFLYFELGVTNLGFLKNDILRCECEKDFEVRSCGSCLRCDCEVVSRGAISSPFRRSDPVVRS